MIAHFLTLAVVGGEPDEVGERSSGVNISAALREALLGVEHLPVPSDAWDAAAHIEQHLCALDAIHLATCELVGASLLGTGLDHQLRDVAIERGVTVLG